MRIGSGIGLGMVLLGFAPQGSAQSELNFAAQLTVTVEGLASQEGNVCFKVFSGSQGFPNEDDNAVVKSCMAIAEMPLSVTFEDLTVGNYAVAIYHDANGDEMLNRGLFGMPTEGYGFSNDAIARTGPASYEDAMILVGGNTAITISMQYP